MHSLNVGVKYKCLHIAVAYQHVLTPSRALNGRIKVREQTKLHKVTQTHLVLTKQLQYVHNQIGHLIINKS